jgi:hypothetical protein
MKLSIKYLLGTPSINDAQHKTPYIEYQYAKCCVSFIVMLSAFMLSVFMLSVGMLNVVILSVVAPYLWVRRGAYPRKLLNYDSFLSQILEWA